MQLSFKFKAGGKNKENNGNKRDKKIEEDMKIYNKN